MRTSTAPQTAAKYYRYAPTRTHEHTHICILLWSYCCHCYRSGSKLPSCKKLHKTNLYTFLKRHVIVLMVILHVDVQLRWHCWSICEISLRLVVGFEWISMNLATLCLFLLPEHWDVNITTVTMLTLKYHLTAASYSYMEVFLVSLSPPCLHIYLTCLLVFSTRSLYWYFWIIPPLAYNLFTPPPLPRVQNKLWTLTFIYHPILSFFYNKRYSFVEPLAWQKALVFLFSDAICVCCI